MPEEKEVKITSADYSVKLKIALRASLDCLSEIVTDKDKPIGFRLNAAEEILNYHIELLKCDVSLDED